MAMHAHAGSDAARTARTTQALRTLAGIAAGTALAITSCEYYPTDVETLEPPSVTALQVSPDAVNVTREAATVSTMIGTRSGASVDSAVVRLRSPSGAQTRACSSHQPSSGTRTAGAWFCDFILEQGAEAGAWLVAGIDIFPDRGEAFSASHDDLAAAGYARSVRAIIEALTTARITSPADGSRFIRGDNIDFAGSGEDAEGAALSGNALAWRSSVDGVIGAGTAFRRADLSAGEHTITLTATDASGNAATDSSRIVVLLHAPVATVQVTPPDIEVNAIGDTVRFAAAAFDEHGSLIDEAVFAWSSSDTTVATVDAVGLASATGFGTATIRATLDSVTASATLRVRQPLAPTVTISAPDEGASFEEAAAVAFAGSATADDGAPLTGAALVWTSSRDGQIGTGTSFTRSDLSVGVHEITMTATDMQGLQASTSRTVTITPRVVPPPTVTIASPAEGSTHAAGDVISFAGSATADDGAPLTGGALVWTSSRDGQIGTGTSFTRSNLSAGVHEITLTATDTQGLQASASRTISVTTLDVPPPAGMIVYSSNNRLATIAGDGGNARDWERLGGFPAWSPDGSRIVYTVNQRLWIIDSDGNNARRLTEFQTGPPSWSPDGREVAIQSSVDGATWSILIVNPETGDSIRRLTATVDADQYPAWSPDGSRIAISRNGALTLLDASSGSVVQSFSLGTTIRHPKWSPDGSRIAYTRAESGARRSMHVVEVATGTVTTLVNETGTYAEYPAWSPDGNWIVYAARPDGGRFDLFIMRADAEGAPVRLTNNPSIDDNQPHWTAAVTTPGAPPAASIAAPVNNTTFTAGDVITFTGSALDHAGSALMGNALVWTSSRDGQVGTGTSFTRGDLSVGAHTITLTATDADGRIGTAAVSITVQAPDGPAAWVATQSAGNPIITSVDGMNWQARTSPVRRARGVGRSSDLWIVTGDISASDASINLVTSPDGITWTVRETAFQNTAYFARWNGSMWLAGAASRDGSPTLARSTDGITWTSAGQSPFYIATLGAAWNGYMWIAVGAGGIGTGTTIARSTDGVNWEASESPFGTSTTINNAGWDVAWNGSMWVAVGAGSAALATSTDGITWTPRSVPFTAGYGVAWNGSMWVAVGTRPTGGHAIATSTDGITWTGRASPFTIGQGVAWDGTMWVAAGSGSYPVATSTDGITWTALAVPHGNGSGVASVNLPPVPTPTSPPTVAITAPEAGATFIEGSDVGLAGTATDGVGRPLTALAWHSSRDGDLGTGASVLVGDLSIGEHRITASATDMWGRTGSAHVDIEIMADAQPEVTSIVVEPGDITVGSTGTQQFTATAYDQLGRVMAGVTFEWSSSGLCIATVDENGLVTAALAPGTATIRASAGGVTGSATFRVQHATGGAPDNLSGTWTVCRVSNGEHLMTLDLTHTSGEETFTGTVTMASGVTRPLYSSFWRDNVLSTAWTLLVQGGERTFSIVGAVPVHANLLRGTYNDRIVLDSYDVYLVRSIIQ